MFLIFPGRVLCNNLYICTKIFCCNFIYKYKEVNEEEVELDVIESEEEFEKVSKTFEEIFDDEEEE